MSYTIANDHMEELSGVKVEGSKEMNQLIGFKLGAARSIALEKGYYLENIIITAPPKLEISNYDDSFRVLRVHTLVDNRLTILVCKPL